MRRSTTAQCPALLATLLVLVTPAGAGAAEPPPTADHSKSGEDAAELARWESLLVRLRRAGQAHDQQALGRIDELVATELAQERREAAQERRLLLEEVQRDGRAAPSAARPRAAAPHHERLDLARLEAMETEWRALRGRYGITELERRGMVLTELVAHAHRELTGDKAAPEVDPADAR